MDRASLNKRIDQRVDQMMESGLLQEAQDLFTHRNLNSMNTVGYKELFDYIEGKYTLDQAIEKIKTHTRRFAKRQMTWFRKDKDINWFDPNDLSGIIELIMSVENN